MGCVLGDRKDGTVDQSAFYDQFFVRYVVVSLRRYAGRWRKALVDHANRERLLLNQPVIHPDGETVEYLERMPTSVPSPEDQCFLNCSIDETISDSHLYRAFQQLTPRQRTVIVGLVVNGERQQSLANRLGVTQQAVFRTKTQALFRLRAALESQGVSRSGRPASSSR